MTDAENNGYLIGTLDIKFNRWDVDNAIPPYQYMQHTEQWYKGYAKAYFDAEPTT